MMWTMDRAKPRAITAGGREEGGKKIEERGKMGL